MVRIIDRNLGGKSVTNDAELVVRDLVEFGVPVDNRQIIYRDSEGHWSVLRTRLGAFAGFMPIGDDRAS